MSLKIYVRGLKQKKNLVISVSLVSDLRCHWVIKIEACNGKSNSEKKWELEVIRM